MDSMQNNNGESNDSKEMIYHYTTLDSFNAMLQSPTNDEIQTAAVENNIDFCQYLDFHASYVGMMNDKRENKLLEELLKKFTNQKYLFLSLSKWGKGWPYVISFSKQKDFLPMWMGYANDVIGICLEFSKNDFLSKIKNICRFRPIPGQ